VGAGLSFDFGYPGWNKLLEDIADQEGRRSQVDRLLARHQFEEAAEDLATALPSVFDDTLRLALDHGQLPNCSVKAPCATCLASPGDRGVYHQF
jgi:hypothetical protein